MSDSANRADSLLEARRDVLEMIVRGRPLREVLDALCKIVEMTCSMYRASRWAKSC
jgi:FixJ family two-component response regulator